MNNQKESVIEKIINYVLDILIFVFGIVLLISLYISIQTKVFKNDYANFFGYSIFEVQTGSMSGTIEAGDWIIVDLSKKPKLNDIVTYESNGNFITHRVIEIYGSTYVTMGDANSAKDDPIDGEEIVGTVSKILPRLGIIRKTLFNPVVLIAVIIVLFVLNWTFKNKNNVKTKESVNKVVLNMKDVLIKLIDKIKEIINSKKSTKPVIKELPKIETKKDNDISFSREEMLNSAVDNSIGKESDNIETVTDKKDDIKSPDSNNNSKEEVTNNEVSGEDDLSKTAMYRFVFVDKDEFNKDNIKNTVIEKPEVEEVKVEPKKEIVVEEKKENSDVKLELINDTKKAKNIIDKVMSIKIEEFKDILVILEGEDRDLVNEITIKNEFFKAYINVRYYNIYEANEFSNPRFVSRVENTIKKLGSKMISEYKGSDNKYSDKIEKYIRLFMTVANFEQIYNSKADNKRKQELYFKTLNNYYRDDDLDNSNIKYLVNSIIKIKKKYDDTIFYILDSLNSDKFGLKFSRINDLKNTFGVKLLQNIDFDKMYSSYIINKTYKEGIIAEDKISVTIALLLKQLVLDMLNTDYDNKYVIYLPSSLYDKEKKYERFIKSLNDDYAKSHVSILVSIKDFLDNRDYIKEFTKEGYNFSIVYDSEVKILYEDYGNLYIANNIFIDKDSINVKKVFAFIPEEIYSRFIYDDILNKVDGSE
ncbi:MAG: hypothetical protein PUJ60_05225 [bacterium]|nr:hypothetical protein [bacterium]MDY4108685.1 hypothetical protein [Bacilli bacterium]